MNNEEPMTKHSPVVLITGAGRRIGRALALRFAERGWRIAVHYGGSREGALRTLEDVRALGAEGVVVQADVRRRDEVRRAVAEAYAALGRIDLLVNNAGVYPQATPIEDVDEEMWRSTLDTNLSGEFFAAQAVVPVMRSQPEGGAIVNIASLGAFQTWRNRIPYNTSKSALLGLTRALARSLAPHIPVNAVAPGVIEIPEEPAEGSLLAAERIPFRRHGNVEDIFRAVWFLGVEARYITGQTLIVDGGLHIAQETSQE